MKVNKSSSRGAYISKDIRVKKTPGPVKHSGRSAKFISPAHKSGGPDAIDTRLLHVLCENSNFMINLDNIFNSRTKKLASSSQKSYKKFSIVIAECSKRWNGKLKRGRSRINWW
jgi:hypothetical protein